MNNAAYNNSISFVHSKYDLGYPPLVRYEEKAD